MAKGNPFLKGLTNAEIIRLRKYSPYIDKVYDPKTNIVNYEIIIERLKNVDKTFIPEEEIFLKNIKRNLIREYLRQGLTLELTINGEYGDRNTGEGGWAPSTNRLNNQQIFLDSFFSSGTNKINDPSQGFDNYYSSGYKAGLGVTTGLKIGLFMPEDYNRYTSQHHKIGAYQIPVPYSWPNNTEYYYWDVPCLESEPSKKINNEKTREKINSLKKIFNDINNLIELINEKAEKNKSEIENLQKEVKNLNEELNHVKKIVEIQGNKIKQLEDKLYKNNNYFNNDKNFCINYLTNQINKKDEEVNNLKIKIQSIEKKDKIITTFQEQIVFINIVSTDQKIKKEIICLKNELFSEIEERLYKEFPEYKNK